MGNNSCGGKAANQDAIWKHFQNELPDSFDGAKPRLDYIVKQISKKAKCSYPIILNIGVGNGYLEQLILKRGWEIYSLDPDEGTIKNVISKGIKGFKGYIEQMPFNDESFDFVIASEVLEHLNDSQRSLGFIEVARVLKPSGWFIGTVPYCENLLENRVICPKCGEIFHRWGHYKSFDISSITCELSDMFEVAEIKRTAFVKFWGRTLTGKMKTIIRLFLAKKGKAIALPSIFFAVRKK